MSTEPRSFPMKRLIPFTILALLLILLLQNLSAEAASPPVVLLGITPTPTPTVTPTPLPTPTSPPETSISDPVITKRGEPEDALPGEEVVFTLEVTNQGQEPAIDVVVTDVIPEFLEVLEVTTTQGTVTIEGQTVTVDIGVVGPGFVVQIVIRTRVREDAPVPLNMENVASLDSSNSDRRTSPPVVITVPGPLLPPTGQPSVAWLTYILIGGGGGLLALSEGLRRRRGCK